MMYNKTVEKWRIEGYYRRSLTSAPFMNIAISFFKKIIGEGLERLLIGVTPRSHPHRLYNGMGKLNELVIK